MLCPTDDMPMHQKSRIGDGEKNSDVVSCWELKECPVCGYMIVEFSSKVVVQDTEQARTVGGMLIARAAEVAA